MFEYTREFIINDNKGTLGTAKDKKFIGDTTNNLLMVQRMANIRKKDVVSVHKYVAAAEADESVTLTLNTLQLKAAGDVVRLKIVLGQEGRVISTFNDQYPWHTKTLLLEGKTAAATSSSTTAYVDDTAITAIVAAAKKNAAMEAEDHYVELSGDASALVIAATDCYTRILSVEVEELVATSLSDAGAGAILTGYEDYHVLGSWKRSEEATGLASEFSAGTEGAGTVARILKNMRLQTLANTDPWGLQRDERPVPGALYNQYTIECVSERRAIGHQVFGAIDQSLTTYVFFVNTSDDVASDFEEALDALTDQICSVPTTPKEAGKDAHLVMDKNLS